jgi:hypothetical protein
VILNKYGSSVHSGKQRERNQKDPGGLSGFYARKFEKQSNIPVSTLAPTMLPYPTLSEAISHAANKL